MEIKELINNSQIDTSITTWKHHSLDIFLTFTPLKLTEDRQNAIKSTNNGINIVPFKLEIIDRKLYFNDLHNERKLEVKFNPDKIIFADENSETEYLKSSIESAGLG